MWQIYTNPYASLSYVPPNLASLSDTTYPFPFFGPGCGSLIYDYDQKYYPRIQFFTIGGIDPGGVYESGVLLHWNEAPLYVHNAPEIPNRMYENDTESYVLGEEVTDIYQYDGFKTRKVLVKPSGYIYNTGTQEWVEGGTISDGFWNQELAPGIMREPLGTQGFTFVNFRYNPAYTFPVLIPRKTWVRDKATYRMFGLDPVPGSPCVQGNTYINGDCFLSSGLRVDGVNWTDITEEGYKTYGSNPTAFRWGDSLYIFGPQQRFVLNRTYDTSALCQADVSGFMYLSLSAKLHMNATNSRLEFDDMGQPTEVGKYLVFCDDCATRNDLTLAKCFKAPEDFASIDYIDAYPLFATDAIGLVDAGGILLSDSDYNTSWDFPFFLNFPYYDVEPTGGIVNHVVGKAIPYLTYQSADSRAFYSHQLTTDEQTAADFFVAIGPSGDATKWIYAELNGSVGTASFYENETQIVRYFISITNDNGDLLARAPIRVPGGNIDICYAYNVFSVSCGGSKIAVEHHFVDVEDDINVIIGSRDYPSNTSNAFVEVDCVYFKHPSALLNTVNVYDDFCYCEAVGNAGNTIYSCNPYPTTRNLFDFTYLPGTYTIESWGIKCLDCGGTCYAFEHGGAPEAVQARVLNIFNNSLMCGDYTLYGVERYSLSYPVYPMVKKTCNAAYDYDCLSSGGLYTQVDAGSVDCSDGSCWTNPMYTWGDPVPPEFVLYQASAGGCETCICDNTIVWFGGVPYKPPADYEVAKNATSNDYSIEIATTQAALVLVYDGEKITLQHNIVNEANVGSCMYKCVNTNIGYALWDLTKQHCGTNAICSLPNNALHPCDINGVLNYIYVGEVPLVVYEVSCDNASSTPDSITYSENSDLADYSSFPQDSFLPPYPEIKSTLNADKSITITLLPQSGITGEPVWSDYVEGGVTAKYAVDYAYPYISGSTPPTGDFFAYSVNGIYYTRTTEWTTTINNDDKEHEVFFEGIKVGEVVGEAGSRDFKDMTEDENSFELYDMHVSFDEPVIEEISIDVNGMSVPARRVTVENVLLKLPGCASVIGNKLSVTLPTLIKPPDCSTDPKCWYPYFDAPYYVHPICVPTVGFYTDYVILYPEPLNCMSAGLRWAIDGCSYIPTYTLGPLGWYRSNFYNPPHNFMFQLTIDSSWSFDGYLDGCESFTPGGIGGLNATNCLYMIRGNGLTNLPEIQKLFESPQNCRDFNDVYVLTNSKKFNKKSYVDAGRCLDGLECKDFSEPSETVVCKNYDGDISIHNVYTRLVGLTYSWFYGHENDTLMMATSTSDPVPPIQQCNYNRSVGKYMYLDEAETSGEMFYCGGGAQYFCEYSQPGIVYGSGNIALHTSVTNYKGTGPTNCRIAHDRYLNYSYAYEYYNFDTELWKRHEGLVPGQTTCTHRSMYATYDVCNGDGCGVRDAYELLHGPRGGFTALDLAMTEPYMKDDQTLAFRRRDTRADVDAIGKTGFDIYVGGYRYHFPLDTEVHLGKGLPGMRKIVYMDSWGSLRITRKTVQELYGEIMDNSSTNLIIQIAEIIYGTSEYEYFDLPDDSIHSSAFHTLVDLRPLNTYPLKSETVRERYIDYVDGTSRYRDTTWYSDFSGFEDAAKTTLFIGGGGQIVRSYYSCCADDPGDDGDVPSDCRVPYYQMDFDVGPRVELYIYNGGILFRDQDEPADPNSENEVGWLHRSWAQYPHYIVYFSGNPIKVESDVVARVTLPDEYATHKVYLERDGEELTLQYTSGTIPGTEGWDWLPVCTVEQEHVSTNEIDYRYNAVSGGYLDLSGSMVGWDNIGNIYIEPSGAEAEDGEEVCWHYSTYLDERIRRIGTKKNVRINIEGTGMNVVAYLDDQSAAQYCLLDAVGLHSVCSDIPHLAFASGTFATTDTVTDLRAGGTTNYVTKVSTLTDTYTIVDPVRYDHYALHIFVPSCQAIYGTNTVNIGGSLTWYMRTPLIQDYYLYAKTLNRGLSYQPYVSTVEQTDNNIYLPIAKVERSASHNFEDIRQEVSVTNSGVGGFLDYGNMEMRVDPFGACVTGVEATGPHFIIDLPCDDTYTVNCYNTNESSGISRGYTFVTPTGGLYTKYVQEYVPLDSGFGRYYIWYNSEAELETHFEDIYKIFPAEVTNGVAVSACTDGDNPAPSAFQFPDDSIPLLSTEFIRKIYVTDQRVQPAYEELGGYFENLELHHITQPEDTCLECGLSDNQFYYDYTFAKCATVESTMIIDALMGDELSWQSGVMFCSLHCELYSGITV